MRYWRLKGTMVEIKWNGSLFPIDRKRCAARGESIWMQLEVSRISGLQRLQQLSTLV